MATAACDRPISARHAPRFAAIPPVDRCRALGLAHLAQMTFLLAATCSFLVPTFLPLVHGWNTDQDISHGPLVLFAAGYMAYRAWREQSGRAEFIFDRQQL